MVSSLYVAPVKPKWFPPPGQECYSCACAMDWCCCPGDGPERVGRAGIIGMKFMEQKTTVNIFLFVLLSNKSFLVFVGLFFFFK